MFSAVIYTSGRTGSQLIVNNLSTHFKSRRRNYYDTNFVEGIVHSHNPLYIPPTNDFICIINKRRNLFDSIVSSLLGSRTGEFIKYSNKLIEPFEIPVDEFEGSYLHHIVFYKLIDTSYYNNVVEIYYEDLIADPKHLFSKFGIDKTITNLTEKSPYDYYKLITNINQLKSIFDELEKTIIPADTIDAMGETIVKDLEDIRLNYNGNRPF